jgi:iron complex outermembrane receptor protein
VSRALLAGLLLALDAAAAAADPAAAPNLSELSLEQLANIDITSVSKAPEPLSDAPAAVYVITHDDIVRSGAVTIPEMLRLAPNLQVAQINATSYAISARGFNLYGSDKLLVLIDGRSVYTPFFSGVFWDEQNVPPEDIDRIEVVSGPGATLWGANAVNGVINIITRKSGDTQGGFVDAEGGNRLYDGAAQYGGKIGANATYRVYGEGLEERHDTLMGGGSAMDGWRRQQGGFRADWAKAGDLLTLQGDAYQNPEQSASVFGASTLVTGRNLLARWTHQSDGGSSLQVQTYYDYSARLASSDAGGDRLNVYDLDVQDSLSLGTRQAIVLGGGYRIEDDEFNNNLTPALSTFFSPASATLERSNVFAQDTVSLTDRLKLTPGIKFEKDAYVPWEPLPSVRLAWKVTDANLLWTAVSRAARAPSREDRNLDEAFLTLHPPVYFVSGGTMQSEKLIAYEAGWRTQPLSRLSLSISTFYNVYQDLRSFQETTGTIFPLFFSNDMEGETWGAEIWGSYQVTTWWRLSAGVNFLREHLRFKPGSSMVLGIAASGDDPTHQESLRSSIDLTHNVTFDADVREVGSLPSPQVPSYGELDARLGWKITEAWSAALSGFNLMHAHHLEYVEPSQTAPVEIGRSFLASAQWRF